jgi:aldose 1-epimerase
VAAKPAIEQCEAAAVRLSVIRRSFGALADGQPVSQYTLMGDRIELHVIDYGAAITQLWTPNRDGQWNNVVLGYDTLDGYLDDPHYLGAVVGRYANRIANARFTLGGHLYRLSCNEGPHHLHGGVGGFSRRLWRSSLLTPAPRRVGVMFTHVSEAGEEGYPGRLEAQVVYELTVDGEVVIRYLAETSAPTIVNLTQHSYFNLSGEARRAVDQTLTIDADGFLPVDGALLPFGPIATVADTPFDFRLPQPIASHAEAVHSQLRVARGFDHTWVLRSSEGPAAVLRDPVSGRQLEVTTTEPGLHFYDGHLLRSPFNAGGVCLETQHFPDSPNRPQYPSSVLLPGDTYRSMTTWRFSAD